LGRCTPGSAAQRSRLWEDALQRRPEPDGRIQIEGDDPDVCAVNVTGSLLGGNFTFIEDPNI
jgi:hypothetical protein